MATGAIDYWIGELEEYDFNQLCAKPAPSRWSLGQVYVHLIRATGNHLAQAEICLSTNDNAAETMSPNGVALFRNNGFPDQFIEGPPSNANTTQPESKEGLMRDLLLLKQKISQVEMLASSSTFTGKTKHPGLLYFNGKEWLQFAEMHFRHHQRQKKRIDDFLKASNQRG